MKKSLRRLRVGRYITVFLVGSAIFLSLPRAALPWGRQAHEMVNRAAIENLPEPLRSYLRERRAFLAEHASDPDALSSKETSERIHHFTDAEAYEAHPFPHLRKQFVEERRGPTERQRREGDSIWQIDFYAQRLAEAWRRGDWARADQDAIFMAHYACDLTQPLHTVLNYDGQFTRQAGIHGRFEAELVNAERERWTLKASPANLEADVRARIFREYLASYEARNQIYAADREAVRGRTYLDAEYFQTFVSLASPVAKRRLEAAVSFVSSLWYTAWVRAGKPHLGSSQSRK